MIHKFSELKASIKIDRQGSGRALRCQASCPLCGYTHAVDVLGSEAAAESMAAQNIQAHLKARHSAEFDPGS